MCLMRWCKSIEINRFNKQPTDLQLLHKYIAMNVSNYSKSFDLLSKSPYFHSSTTLNYTHE